ncbi:hypothetical protein KY290_026055 [Solanum tuberosum]|uniref:Retrotransposon Copia-like N-terminal domain-containing protein n=1 Tax=Solanum tuberosum TaxID=4113 RepID=A0ABQ7UYF1_SOLTU|nr:hypothetical protein KY290_026055 [Solanum tuberosum]
MASKSIIADLNKGEKLNGDNYDIWSHKTWYVLEEQNALKVNFTARGIIVSSVVDDLIHECEEFSTAHAMWEHL